MKFLSMNTLEASIELKKRKSSMLKNEKETAEAIS